MKLVFHPRVFAEIDAIMKYYEGVADSKLADEFYAELRQAFAAAAEQPELVSERVGNFK